MSSLDLELDGRMDDLELEWREAREASILARAEYLALGADLAANADLISTARDRVRRAETREARVYSKIELLEDSMLGLS
jgi:type II secretory pathway component PulK